MDGNDAAPQRGRSQGSFFGTDQRVERGEAVEITRRGVPVARMVRASGSAGKEFDLEAFLGATTGQPLHPSCDAAALVAELREGARY